MYVLVPETDSPGINCLILSIYHLPSLAAARRCQALAILNGIPIASQAIPRAQCHPHSLEISQQVQVLPHFGCGKPSITKARSPYFKHTYYILGLVSMSVYLLVPMKLTSARASGPGGAFRWRERCELHHIGPYGPSSTLARCRRPGGGHNCC